MTVVPAGPTGAKASFSEGTETGQSFAQRRSWELKRTRNVHVAVAIDELGFVLGVRSVRTPAEESTPLRSRTEAIRCSQQLLPSFLGGQDLFSPRVISISEIH